MWNWTDYNNELYHHGIKGQKWGIRRFQNSDGSLTQEGRARYGTAEKLYEDAAKRKAGKSGKAFKRAAVSYGLKIAVGVGGGILGGSALAAGKRWAKGAILAASVAETVATWSGRINLAKSAINMGQSIYYLDKQDKAKQANAQMKARR